MAFYIKDKSGKYRDSDGQWKTHVRRCNTPFSFQFVTAEAAQAKINEFSRMSLAETEATVVEEE